MDDIYMALYKFFTVYGWQMAIIAIIGIILQGVLKMCGAYDWIVVSVKNAEGEKLTSADATKQVKKLAYILTAVAFSVAGCCTYLGIIKADFTLVSVLGVALSIYTINQLAYIAYETLGVRTVWQKALSKLKSAVIAYVEARQEAKAAQAETAATTLTLADAIKIIAEATGVDKSLIEALVAKNKK